MALGDIADYLIGLLVERIWPQASLLIFLVLYFVFLWIAWLLAVRLTEPKTARQTARKTRLCLASNFIAAMHSNLYSPSSFSVFTV